MSLAAGDPGSCYEWLAEYDGVSALGGVGGSGALPPTTIKEIG
jgi:hypothetical protein